VASGEQAFARVGESSREGAHWRRGAVVD